MTHIMNPRSIPILVTTPTPEITETPTSVTTPEIINRQEESSSVINQVATLNIDPTDSNIADGDIAIELLDNYIDNDSVQSQTQTDGDLWDIIMMEERTDASPENRRRVRDLRLHTHLNQPSGTQNNAVFPISVWLLVYLLILLLMIVFLVIVANMSGVSREIQKLF